MKLLMPLAIGLLLIACDSSDNDFRTGVAKLTGSESDDVKADDKKKTKVESLVDIVEDPDIKDIIMPNCLRWHNGQMPSDVTGDGFASPLDALRIINELNRANGAYTLSMDFGTPEPDYYDVNGDCRVSGADAHAVIDELSMASNGAACAIWQNSPDPFDVNNDGTVNSTDFDVLNAQLENPGARIINAGSTTSVFLDVDGDCIFSAHDGDALQKALVGLFPSNSFAAVYKPWHNKNTPMDVNGDNRVSTYDAKLISDFLVANGIAPVPLDKDREAYLDVDGDGWIAANDFNILMDHLKAEAEK